MSSVVLSQAWLEKGATVLSNSFILDYLPTVSQGDYLKVYLYGLMHAQCHTPLSIAEMAFALNLKEDDVVAAYRFWERRQLVVRLQDKPLLFAYLPPEKNNVNMVYSEKYQELSDLLYSLFGEKRILHGSQIAIIQDWIDELGFSLDTLLVFLNFYIAHKGIDFSFSTAQKDLIKMKTLGILSVDDMEHYLTTEKETLEGAIAVLKRFRIRRQPTEDELSLYKKWIDQYHFTSKDILTACTETINANNPSFGYLDGVLKRLYELGEKAESSSFSVEEALKKQNQEADILKQILSTMGLPTSKRYVDTPLKTILMPLVNTFSLDYVLFVAAQLSLKGAKLDGLVAEMERLKENNILTLEQVKQFYYYNAKADKLLFKIYECAGIDKKPSSAERKNILKWQTEWHISEDMLILAAEMAKGANKPLPYINAIVERWHALNITTKDEAQTLWQEHKEEFEKSKRQTKPTTKMVSHQQYEQRQYHKNDINDWVPEFLKEEHHE